MLKQFYTYLHCKPDGTPFYVGKGCRNRSKLIYRKHNRHYDNIVAKYGKNNILIYVFPCDSEEQAFADEIQQIAQLRAAGYQLSNKTDGGEGISGFTFSQPMSARIKISISLIGNTRGLGYKHTPAEIEKIRLTSTGRIFSDAHRQKISARMSQQVLSEEQKNRLRTLCIGRKHSAETKRKMSESQKLRHLKERN